MTTKKYEGFRFIFDDSRDYIQREMMKGHFFEQEELEILSSCLNKDSVILDVGAHIGSHTIYWSKIDQVKLVYAIEPLPRAYKMLLANLALNYCHNVNVDYLGLGFGSKEEVRWSSQEFENNLGSTKLDLARSWNSQQEEIKIIPGDNLFRDKKIDFIKIDVEHMEIEVLQGLKETIAKNRPKIFVEVQNPNKQNFFSWMTKNDYQFSDISFDNSLNLERFENFLIAPK